MADFVEIAENSMWPHLPDPPFLDDQRDASTPYLQDHMKVDVIQGERAEARTDQVDKYASKGESGSILVQDSLSWPMSAYQRDLAMPYVGAVLGGFLLAPVLVGDMSVGSAVLTGYAVGAGIMAWQISSMPVKKKDVINRTN